jgi:serine/threonine-protein kinase
MKLHWLSLFGACAMWISASAAMAQDADALVARIGENRELVAAGRLVEAEAGYRQILNQLDQLDEEPPLVRSVTWNDLGMLLLDQRRPEDSLDAMTKAVALATEAAGSDSPPALVFSTNRILVLEALTRNDEAIAEYRRLIAIREAAQPVDAMELATLLNNMGVNLIRMNQPDPAEAALRRSIALREGVVGPEHPSTAVSYSALGSLLLNQGRMEVAEAMLRRALATLPDTVGADIRGGAESALINALIARGKYDEAAQIATAALAQVRQTVGEDDPRTGAVLYQLAEIRFSQGRTAEAAPLLEEAVGIFRTRLPGRKDVLISPLWLLAAAENRTGRREQALAHLNEALQAADGVYPPGDMARTRARAELGATLAGWGRSDQALPILREAGAAVIERSHRRAAVDMRARRDMDRLRPIFRLTVSTAWEEAHSSDASAAGPTRP